MTNNAILLADGHHGIYIPQIIALDIIECRLKVKNFKDIKWELGELGNPDNESYWDAWNQLMDKAIFLNKFGKEYYLHQEDDLWAVPVGEYLIDEY
jgi:hypothetical protein